MTLKPYEKIVVRNDETVEYYRDSFGKLHRENGPAVIRASGKKEWYYHGVRHREDGPAIEWSDGRTQWWNHGKIHRLDGPAKTYPSHFLGNSSPSHVWYINDYYVNDVIFPWAKEIGIDLDNLSEYDKMMIVMKFGNQQ